MGKKLSEMTLEELWQLFPIILTAHDPRWKAWYAEKAQQVEACLPQGALARISHIGSTAVEGIWAKPIVDILAEVWPEADMEAARISLCQNGWVCMGGDARGMSFNQGYTEDGFAEKVYHLHLRRAGDDGELYFRDYLNEYPAAAKEYEALKLGLWRRYEHDRDAYTHAKGELVQKYTALARLRYPGRYQLPLGCK